MTLTDNDIAVLRAMEMRSPDFGFMSFGAIARDSGVDRKAIRRIVRKLARYGLAEFSSGLWTDDGRPAGAGYAITSAGRAEIPFDASFYAGTGQAA